MNTTPVKSASSINFFLLQVVRYEDITPHMRRITLTGNDTQNQEIFTPGMHIKVFIPQAHQEQPVFPRIEKGRPVMPEKPEAPAVRTYTVRHYDAATGELSIDFVLHGDEGPASAWASRVEAGKYLGIAARAVKVFMDTDWYLLAGDQTALPAISAILESLPASARGFAFVEIPDASEEQPLTYTAQIPLKWLHRNGAAAGTSDLLRQAVEAISIPSENRYVWIAAESTKTKEIRDYLKQEYHLQNDELYAIAYWKLGMDEDAYHNARHQEREN